MGEGTVRTTLYGFETREPDLRLRSDPDRPRPHDIKKLWQRHHEIVNLAVRGFKQVEIAEILNIDPQTVSHTLNSQLGMQKLSEIRYERDQDAKKVAEKIRVLTDKALRTYHEIFDDESGECGLKDKMKAADVVLLELSGLRAPTRIQSHHVSMALTPNELEEFKRRGIEAAREAGMLIEVEPKQIEDEVDSKIEQTNDPIQELTEP